MCSGDESRSAQAWQADNGTPSLSATRSFVVTVSSVTLLQFSTVSLNGKQLVLQINVASGPDYQIQASTNLMNWSTVFTTNAPTVPANSTENSGEPLY